MDNANLEKLKVSHGKLVPKFKATVTEYSLTVPSSVGDIKLTILTSDSGASYAIKGTDGGGKIIKIAEGQKVDVEVVVSAEDGTTTKTYTIAAHRLSANDATLSQLDLSVGELSPHFSPYVQQYECYLPCSCDTLSIRAKTEEAAMKLTMKDGSPVGTLQLNPGRTLAELSVESANGKSSTVYSITFLKCRLPVILQLKKKNDKFECAVCCGVVNKPTRIKNSPYIYCQSCLSELTKTNKLDPFTGKRFPDEHWMEDDLECDAELGAEEAFCPLPSGEVTGSMQEIGKNLMAESRKLADVQEVTLACKECSKKVPQNEMPLHLEMLCTAKHPRTVKVLKAKKKNWEKHLMDETIGNDTNELIKKGLEWEKEYIKSLPNPGETPQYVANRSPLDHLLKAARCYATALQTSPKNMELNLALGLVMEEFFYVDDLFGMQREEDEVEKEGEAEMSSKQEEFLAICKLHGVAPSASISIQLKAVESEYHNLKDAGQTHKAEHVQALHAWKSKKVLQESQGSYAVDQESPLFRAKVKYEEAVTINPSDGIACYHLGRISLLLGDKDVALDCLMTAVANKPTFSPARFCLGLVLPSSASAHAKVLLCHGLSEYLMGQQLLHETRAEPQKKSLKELNSKIIYRSTNTLIADGFLQLSLLSGHSHLTTTHCLLSVAACVAQAHLHHRASTYERLLWSSLKARSLLLDLIYKERGESSTLKHCRQLSALISCSGLNSTPQLREMQMNVFQLGVELQPNNSEALCHLGNGQLMQYDASSDSHWLMDAELSFRASIEMEGKAIMPNVVPEKLKQEKWWKEKGKVSGSTSTPSTPSAASAKNSGKQPAARQQQSTSRASKPTPSKTAAKTGTTARTTAAVKKPGAGVGSKTTPGVGVGSKTTPKVAPGQRPSQSMNTGRGKNVATLGELKAGADKKPLVKNDTTPAQEKVEEIPTQDKIMPTKAEINKSSYHPRLGLARILAKCSHEKKQEEAHAFYREVIKMDPHVHDAYIELGEMLAKNDPIGAVKVYANFPFSNPPTFDDAFLHGEIVRLLIKSGSFEEPQLVSSMIDMGKALGIGVLDKQVAILEGKFKYAILKQVYAGVHGKPIDNPELQAFFKFKCWQ